MAPARYKQVEKIGSGGFGEVWRVRREPDDAIFAAKFLDGSDGEAIRRFQREVRCTQKLKHRNIVTIVGVQLNNPPYAYIMPAYRTSLYGELGAIRGNAERIRKVFGRVLDGVEYAHAQGVVHRDLKPENVLLNDDDDVVVSDFGLGRIVDEKTTRLTMTGRGLGTALYAAPEQVTDAKHADHRADVFSLGRMLQELFGTVSTAHDLTGIPQPVVVVVERATRANPDDRYTNIAEMRAEFETAMGVLCGEVQGTAIDVLVDHFVAGEASGARDVRDLISKLGGVMEDPDAVHGIVMRLPAEIVATVHAESPALGKQLIRVFGAHARAQSWPFSYTDSIGTTCRRLFEAIRDYESRGEILATVLVVGVEHNRFAVMEMFGILLAGTKDGVEAEVFLRKLREHQTQCERIAGFSAGYVKRSQVPAKLAGLFWPQDSNDDELPF